ncbi:MAG: GLPGLI family protein [Bacteroidota bacterium]
MRTISTVFAVLLFLTKSAAQFKIDDNALYKVTYIAKHFYDTTDLTKVRIDSMSLYAGKKYSLYRNAGYEEYLIRQEKRKQEIINARIANDINGRQAMILPVSQTEMFKKSNAGEFLVKEILAGNTYIITDTIPFIKWDIYDEAKKIGGLNCQKAICRYKGRSYTAWFCPDLPLRTGPWALGGLPGTILEAIDSKNHVLFLFAGYEEAASPAVLITLPEKYTTTTKKDWDKIVAAYLADPIQFSNSNPHNPNVTSIIMPGGVSQRPKRPVINNPIILPEK